MKLIPLSRGLHAMVDDEDYDDLQGFRWFARPSGRTYYAGRNGRPLAGRWVMVHMHAWLTGYAFTDHIDGNGLNNQRSNLRPGSPLTNAMNKRKRRNASSIYKGVSRRPHSGRWHVRITHNGQTEWLGCYATEQEAALVYDDRARRLFGSWAALNFPKQGERSALDGAA